MIQADYDVIVIGAGIAGITAALSLPPNMKVLVVHGQPSSTCSTYKAQGGMAVAAGVGDSPARHAADTLRVGKGVCDPASVAVLTEEAQAGLCFLQAQGVEFCHDETGLCFTREGGHSCHRVAFHYDYTGKHILDVLQRRLAGASHITKLAGAYLVELLTTQGHCCGCLLWYKGRWLTVMAAAVVMATGGYSSLYEHTTNAEGAAGVGLAAAYRAGAALSDMEFVQFHPTAVQVSAGRMFLLSEALRGEGAVLRNSAGERFMFAYHEDGELAPRDEVSRAIVAEQQRQAGQPVYLDARHLGQEFLAKRFQAIYRELKAQGYILAQQLIPIAPTAHYTIGGIKTDLWGRSTLPGLYACGEAAATGVHGANRLASNSLLEGVVFGRRVAEYLRAGLVRWSYRRPETAQSGIGYKATMAEAAVLRQTVDQAAGVIRCRESMARALVWLQSYRCDDTGKRQSEQVYEACSISNAFLLAELLLEAALAREESRGGHYRRDFPVSLDHAFKKHTVQQREKGLMWA